jgi:hypothetical protein
MDDDAGRMVEDAAVDRPGPHGRGASLAAQAEQAGIAVRFVQGTHETLGQVALVVEMIDHVTEIEVVQHHHAGHVADQVEHVPVHRRIAEVVEHAVVLVCVLPEPVDRAPRQRVQAGIVRMRVRVVPRVGLVDHQLDLVVARQFRCQRGAVVGDARACRRQRRDVGQARPGGRCGRRHAFGSGGGDAGQQGAGIGIGIEDDGGQRIVRGLRRARHQHHVRRQAGQRMAPQQRA